MENHSLKHAKTQCSRSKFLLDLLPSITCFTISLRWTFFPSSHATTSHILLQLNTLLLTASIITTTLYIITRPRPLNRNWTFFPTNLKTSVHSVIYNVSRSVIYGLSASMILTYFGIKLIANHFPGLPQQHDVERRIKSPWTLYLAKHMQNAKCMVFMWVVLAAYFLGLWVAWRGFWQDVDQWETVVDEIQEKRRKEKMFLEGRSLGIKRI